MVEFTELPVTDDASGLELDFLPGFFNKAVSCQCNAPCRIDLWPDGSAVAAVSAGRFCIAFVGRPDAWESLLSAMDILQDSLGASTACQSGNQQEGVSQPL